MSERKGLWYNIRKNRGSGKEPTADMLKQEKKIKANTGKGKKYPDGVANFEKRIQNPVKYIENPDGSTSTHRMTSFSTDGRFFAAPEISENKKGELISREGNDAIKNALKTRNVKEFATDAEAKEYAANGYKKGTPMESFEYMGRNKTGPRVNKYPSYPDGKTESNRLKNKSMKTKAKYPDGKGKTKTKYVDSYSDPAYKSYSDSLNVYNKFNDIYSKLDGQHKMNNKHTALANTYDVMPDRIDKMKEEVNPMQGTVAWGGSGKYGEDDYAKKLGIMPDGTKTFFTVDDDGTFGRSVEGEINDYTTAKPKQKVQYRDPEIVKKQQKLKDAGLYKGPLDGIFGDKSKAALKEFDKREEYKKSRRLEPKPGYVNDKGETYIQSPFGGPGGFYKEESKLEKPYVKTEMTPNVKMENIDPNYAYEKNGQYFTINEDSGRSRVLTPDGYNRFVKKGGRVEESLLDTTQQTVEKEFGNKFRDRARPPGKSEYPYGKSNMYPNGKMYSYGKGPSQYFAGLGTGLSALTTMGKVGTGLGIAGKAANLMGAETGDKKASQIGSMLNSGASIVNAFDSKKQSGSGDASSFENNSDVMANEERKEDIFDEATGRMIPGGNNKNSGQYKKQDTFDSPGEIMMATYGMRYTGGKTNKKKKKMRFKK